MGVLDHHQTCHVLVLVPQIPEGRKYGVMSLRSINGIENDASTFEPSRTCGGMRLLVNLVRHDVACVRFCNNSLKDLLNTILS